MTRPSGRTIGSGASTAPDGSGDATPVRYLKRINATEVKSTPVKLRLRQRE